MDMWDRQHRLRTDCVCFVSVLRKAFAVHPLNALSVLISSEAGLNYCVHCTCSEKIKIHTKVS